MEFVRRSYFDLAEPKVTSLGEAASRADSSQTMR